MERSLVIEFVSTALLAAFGSLQPHDSLGNGLLYAVLLYLTLSESSGYLNPAITLGFIAVQKMDIAKGLANIGVQVAGAIVGSLLAAVLTGTMPFVGEAGPGCYHASTGWLRILFWEFLMTFLLVSVVFMLVVHPSAQKTYSSIAPLIVGLAFFVSASTGEKFTGSCLNPARILGASIVFFCGWSVSWAYLIGELLGGSVGAAFMYHFYIKDQEPYMALG